MTGIKDRIAAIDARGREIAATVNERVEAEALVGQSPATIRRVEELIKTAIADAGESKGADFDPETWVDPWAFEFHVIGKGITAKPFVAPSRYTGKVGE